MNLRSGRPTITEPESEIHSDEELKAQFEDRLNERREEIGSLREVVRRQGDAIAELRKTQADKSVAPSRENAKRDSSADESKSYNWSFDLGSSNMWSDDEDDSFPLGGIDRGIHASIEAIREEASRVDTVMALNQLDTLQQELSSLTRAMNSRTAEIEEMRALVRLKDDRLATLELERDLYRADANKMKSDLQTCSERIKGYDLPSLNEPSPVGVSPRSEPSSPSTSYESRPVLLMPRQESDSSVVRQARIEPNRNELSRERFMASGSVRASETDSNVDSDRSRYALVHAQNQSRRDTSERAESQPKARTFLPFRNKPSSRRNGHSSDHPTIDLAGVSLHKQVGEMNERLIASMKASEELRKRLAMISSYYERVVRRLQENMAELKSDRVRMEIDLVNQISSIDIASQASIVTLESELRKKDREVAELKALLL
jgi:hypothetical protein